MNWSHDSIPAMRLEARFGDRVVPAFCERPGSIWALVSDAVARNPDGEALVCGARRMTWREVALESARVAAGLRKIGLRSGDRVALLLGNRIEFVLAMFGAAHLGLVTVLLSTRQQKPEIAYVLSDCGARLLIHEAKLSDRLPDARDVPDLMHRVSVDDGNASQFAGLLDNEASPQPASVGEEETAMILYTSGTTGRPKGAMLAHCNVVHSSMIFVSCLQLTAADLSSWRIGGFGGAPMPIATIEKLNAKIPGLKLMNCYGSTETTSPSTIMPGELTAGHIDSVGLPCPGADIIVVDADGHELPRVEIGEIWIHSGSVIKGYWNNPTATAESFT